jgi:hypothetical protein
LPGRGRKYIKKLIYHENNKRRGFLLQTFRSESFVFNALVGVEVFGTSFFFFEGPGVDVAWKRAEIHQKINLP